MAAASTPSNDLKNKTNVNPVGNRLQEATAEDFQELGQILDDHAIKLDGLENNSSLNPFYGRYTSLALLQAAHSVGELNAWAIIDAGLGITPLIAIWDDVASQWEISGAVDDKVYVANFAALPAPGNQTKWYITTNTSDVYLWYNNQYNLIRSVVSSILIIDGYAVDKNGNQDTQNIQVGDTIRGRRPTNRYIIADVVALPYTTDVNLQIYLDVEK